MHALLLSVLLTAAPARPHAFDVNDLVSLKRLSGFSVSPDGARIAFALRTTDLDANRGRLDLWLVNADGTGLKQLTTHEANDSAPEWSPDSNTVYFLSSRGGSNQVWAIARDGGEAQVVTRAPVDVETFKVSPDGKTLVFSAETFPDCDSLDCTEKRLAEKKKQKTSGQLYDGLFFRHWDTWKDGRRSHLFAQKLDGGAPVDVTRKMNADAPTRPFGGSEEYAFTPDSRGLVFTAREVGREEAWSTDLDLFQVGLDGKGAPKKLTTANRATDTQPVFSPDGKTMAYLAMKRPKFEADARRVVLRSWSDGKERVLTQAWDRSVGSLVFSADGRTLYATADDLGQVALFAIDVASGQARKLYGDGTVLQHALGGNGLVFSRDALDAPADLFLLDLEGKGPAKQLTKVNEDALKQVRFGAFEQFSFPGWNDETVHGYLVKPVGFDPKKKYPLAFLIHGGPQGSFGNHFHYRWNPQTYAGRGYVAVMIDFHGSTGYGQAFTDSISGDWGGKPLEDLKKGHAFALKKYGFIDGKKACALGASYGGFMVNWIAGQWNEPWKCFVNHDGNLDEHMAYFDTEELWFPEWEHGGTPWENRAGYQKHNPVDHVDKWKVPMLVVHGGKDYRVVDTQGMATFTALQRKGIASRFLYFPDENHWVLKPANSVLWHDTVLGWLDQWTKGKQ